GARRERDLEYELSVEALDDAQELVLRNGSSPFLRLAERRHRVDDAHRTARADERRREDVGIGEIGASGAKRTTRCDAPRATPVRVQDGRENRRTVEPWPTQPLDRAVLGDESGGAPVTDDAVVPNRRFGHRRPCPTRRASASASALRWPSTLQ